MRQTQGACFGAAAGKIRWNVQGSRGAAGSVAFAGDEVHATGPVRNDCGACVRLQWPKLDRRLGEDGDYSVVGLKGLEPLRPCER